MYSGGIGAVIQLKNVSKFYYSKGMISSGISKIDLEFDKGEFVVITGESGSGKTTLLNVISGLDSYEEGEMYIDGKETSHFLASDFENYRKKYIGNIFQSFNLVNSYTVYQNIELILRINGYSRSEMADRIPKIIEKVGLTPYTRTKVSKLSGGQKQRVSIARALAKDTDIIVADEPTGNLDSVSAEGIVKLLSEISKDKLVIVVTHNYEQFASYATRKIKMHDGKVVEDEKLTKPINVVDTIKYGFTAGDDIGADRAKRAYTGDISMGSKVRLGVRNTFNILPKFFLLLLVFLFVVFAVISEYTSLQHSEEEASNLGYNDFFYNYSQDRIVVKKGDGSQFTDADLKAMKSISNVRETASNDILLDNTLYVEEGDFSYEAVPKPVSEFEGKLVDGRMPENANEAIITGNKDDYYFSDEMINDICGKDYTVYIGDSKQITVSVVGVAYKDDSQGSYVYGGELYMSDAMIGELLKETYNYNSKITTTINGSEQEYVEGSSLYRIVPLDSVAQGDAVVSEEVNNFYDDGKAEGKQITVKSENIYYSESVSLEISDVYNKRNFENITGINDFESNNGTIYVNSTDYNTLFGKGNYQATVYVDDTRQIDTVKSALENMGYEPLALREAIVTYGNDIVSMIQVPIAVVIVVALFFIAYFVIRLILRSRISYFSILRMLGMTKRNIRRILDVELFVVINIAYAIFIAVVALVNLDVINVEYIRTLVEYMRLSDYVILYAVLIVMGYLISGKFSRNLFKKTAMGSYREED